VTPLERRVTAVEHKIEALGRKIDFRAQVFMAIMVPVIVVVIIAILKRTVFSEG
jgi:hypothetical protein